MLCNAVEYGGHLDPAALVQVRLRRLKRAFICRIKDPGEGFDPASLDHAAINNPNDNPVRHALVREKMGLRGGRLRHSVGESTRRRLGLQRAAQ